jgi:hypothetical protein
MRTGPSPHAPANDSESCDSIRDAAAERGRSNVMQVVDAVHPKRQNGPDIDRGARVMQSISAGAVRTWPETLTHRHAKYIKRWSTGHTGIEAWYPLISRPVAQWRHMVLVKIDECTLHGGSCSAPTSTL